jgi:exonuclease I
LLPPGFSTSGNYLIKIFDNDSGLKSEIDKQYLSALVREIEKSSLDENILVVVDQRMKSLLVKYASQN